MTMLLMCLRAAQYTLCSLHAQFGTQWRRIVLQLPGRTENDAKNRVSANTVAMLPDWMGDAGFGQQRSPGADFFQ